MLYKFSKYQGTGNDFILIDDRAGLFDVTRHEAIARLCHRHFGIGADGLILLQQALGYDFRMVYFNADGHQGSMCGNGGRCVVAFASELGLVASDARFIAYDGPHEASIGAEGWVSLGMTDVSEVKQLENADEWFLDTGSPHHVIFCDDLDNVDVYSKGKTIRYGVPYGQAGTNVNFVEPQTDGSLKVRTYERGVEDETLSCGTGVTAACIASFIRSNGLQYPKGIVVETPVKVSGGELSVKFTPVDGRFTNIWLQGAALKVFEGYVDL
jgi:diaminopimelate epimerase